MVGKFRAAYDERLRDGVLLPDPGQARAVDALERLEIDLADARPAGLFRHTWRCLLATAAMAAVLLRTGLGRHTAAPDAGVLAQQLAVAVVVGVATYSVVLLAAWFAAGRPPGAETDFLALARQLSGRVARVWRPR